MLIVNTVIYVIADILFYLCILLKNYNFIFNQNLSEFNESQFFHLHDINTDGFLDRQEIRLLLITELNQEYKENNEVEYTVY